MVWKSHCPNRVRIRAAKLMAWVGSLINGCDPHGSPGVCSCVQSRSTWPRTAAWSSRRSTTCAPIPTATADVDGNSPPRRTPHHRPRRAPPDPRTRHRPRRRGGRRPEPPTHRKDPHRRHQRPRGLRAGTRISQRPTRFRAKDAPINPRVPSLHSIRPASESPASGKRDASGIRQSWG